MKAVIAIVVCIVCGYLMSAKTVKPLLESCKRVAVSLNVKGR